MAKETKEEYRCDICGKRPFQTVQALAGHKRFAHKGEPTATPATEPTGSVPDVVADFELLLKDYGIKKVGLIAKHIADTGSHNVFDNPKELASKLAMWPRDIANVYRQTILEHWCKSRGITVPQELIEKVGMETDFLRTSMKYHVSVS